MELELGLKITRTRDDITSISQYQLAKDRTGPVFESRETSTMFILTAHLKGYKRNNIEIKISEDGGKISISGEKPIQEMLMMGWVMLKKHVEITKFSKAFKIPEGVVLDRIKAKFDEEESILKIVMPKSVKGICGARIEEVKEDDDIFNSIGETSERGFRETQVQEMEESESVMEKEDSEGFKEEYERRLSVRESEEGNGVSSRDKGGGEAASEAMKTSEIEQKVAARVPQDIRHGKEPEVQEMVDNGSLGSGVEEKKRKMESDKMLDDANGIEGGDGESVREESKKEECEAIEQIVGSHIPQSMGDLSQEFPEESVVQQMKEAEIVEDKESVEERKDGGDECETEKAGTEGYEAITTIREEFPKQLPMASQGGVEASKREEPKLVARESLVEDETLMEVKENTDKGGVHGSERQELLLEGGKSEDFKEEGAKIEQSVKKVNGEKSGKIQAEANEDFRRDLTRDTVEKEIDDPKIPTKESKQLLQESTGKGELEASMAEEVKEELVKQKIEAKVEETQDTEDGAKLEQPMKKMKGEKHEKIQDETTMEGTKEPEIQTKEDDQQCLLEMSKGILEPSEATIEGSAAKTLDSEGLKDTMAEKAKEAKEEFIKQQSGEKTEEPKDVSNGATIEQYLEKEKRDLRKDITKESKIQSEEKDQQSLHDATSEGRFGASTTAREFPLQKNEREGRNEKEIEETMKVKEEIDKRKTKERNVESTEKKISPTRDEKKHETELLSQETQSKETFESRNQCVNQDIVKSNKAKEAERGDQCNCNKERTEAAAAIEDQMAKPKFSTAQQFEEVEEGKLKENSEKKHEPSPKSPKEYHANDLRNSIGMKERESKLMEVSKPEVPLEELLRKSKQETRKDEFQKGEKVEEKMQEIEQSKSKVDGKDQEYVSRETGGATIIGTEMPEAKEQYVSNAVSPAGRKETKKDLEAKATPETEKHYAQIVDDMKIGNRKETKKTVFEENDEVKYAAESRKRTQVKEHQRKSEAAEKEAEPPKLKRRIIEWKSPKKQHGYGTEDTETPKLPAYREVQQPKLQSPTLSQQSTDEENRKPENAAVELPKKNTDTDYRKLVESVDPLEDERVETFQAHIPENQGFEDNQKLYAASRESDNQEGTKAIEEELLKKQYLSEGNVHGEKGVETVSKRGEPEEDPKQLHKREKVKTIQSVTDEKPIMKDITTEFEKVYGSKQVEETMKELPTKIEMISKKGMEIQRKDPPELLWSSMGPEDSHVKEDTTDEGHEEGDIIEVEEDVSGRNNDKTKRTKKLFVPLIIAGSALLVSLVFIFVHRRRNKRR
ncbi:hypothetical protein PIB30_046694 [Stylosanthes scabra]|uniref:SHSP domain-containing protein n=1 Tax=Stylosanthes scabra TaxID=79078 RepID=A0ABU6UF95_9FABA|nr:hypothetical protein [Stylosanthes scabra]